MDRNNLEPWEARIYAELEQFGVEKGISKEKRHILVVDDSAVVLRNVKTLLEPKYSVSVAASGSQALIALGKKRPDLILLDYEMPMMDGKATMELIQMEEEYKNIPIVFLTSVSSKDVVMQLLALKPAGYLLKPAEGDALLRMVGQVLGDES